jgi:hypothetical protein
MFKNFFKLWYRIGYAVVLMDLYKHDKLNYGYKMLETKRKWNDYNAHWKLNIRRGYTDYETIKNNAGRSFPLARHYIVNPCHKYKDSTMFHEMTHILLHRNKTYLYEQKEFECEMVAFILFYLTKGEGKELKDIKRRINKYKSKAVLTNFGLKKIIYAIEKILEAGIK